MTGGEIRMARDALGMNPQQFGRAIGVNPRAVQNFELAKQPVPAGVMGDVQRVEQATRARIEALAAYLRENPDATVPLFSDDGPDRLPDDVPEGYQDIAIYGAKWWRLVVAKATEDLPDAHVGSPTEIRRYGAKWWDIVTQRPASDHTIDPY
jgi:transcriptional regulator with XRE-family HTH domain